MPRPSCAPTHGREGVDFLNLLLVLLAAQTVAQTPATSEAAYARLKPSLFTIEIHSGNREAKSSLGSGYLVSTDGLIATNYHVIASFVDDPVRNQLRAKGERGELPLSSSSSTSSMIWPSFGPRALPANLWFWP